MSKKQFHVKKGDFVEVMNGAHKGATGIIMQVLTAKDQVIIEGVRLIKKHEKKSQDRPQGAISEREGPIHISNVRPADNKPKAASKKSATKKAAAKKSATKKAAAKKSATKKAAAKATQAKD